MPRRDVLTPSQREGLLALPEGPSQDVIERFYTLSPDALAAVRQRRGEASRLVFALHWTCLRYPGRPTASGPSRCAACARATIASATPSPATMWPTKEITGPSTWCFWTEVR